MYKSLEHNQHAEHMAHEAHHAPEAHAMPKRAQYAALVVSVLAAGLAISEQGAKHAEIRVQENLIAAADAWSQYQAKSTRATLSRDAMLIIRALEPGAAAVAEERQKAIAALQADQDRYSNDPEDGLAAIVKRAHDYEHARDHALEQTHAYHNGSAAMELGIVLATASAVINSRSLLGLAGGLGLVGAFCALAGYYEPSLGVF